MCREDPKKAAEALDRFYNAIYDMQQNPGAICVLAVSDCAIFWIHDAAGAGGTWQMITGLLERLRSLHRRMTEHGYLLRSTLAYGHFKYQRRVEMRRLRKDMIVGGAHLDAYAANDRCRHGSIYIIKPTDQEETRVINDVANCAGRFKRFLSGNARRKRLEFVWWVETPDHVGAAIAEVKNADDRFRALIRVCRSGEERCQPTPRQHSRAPIARRTGLRQRRSQASGAIAAVGGGKRGMEQMRPTGRMRIMAEGGQ